MSWGTLAYSEIILPVVSGRIGSQPCEAVQKSACGKFRRIDAFQGLFTALGAASPAALVIRRISRPQVGHCACRCARWRTSRRWSCRPVGFQKFSQVPVGQCASTRPMLRNFGVVLRSGPAPRAGFGMMLENHRERHVLCIGFWRRSSLLSVFWGEPDDDCDSSHTEDQLGRQILRS
jgi:hypothetical protein